MERAVASAAKVLQEVPQCHAIPLRRCRLHARRGTHAVEAAAVAVQWWMTVRN